MAVTTFPAIAGVIGTAVPTAEVVAGQFIYWRGMFRQVLEADAWVGIDGLQDQVRFRLAGTRAVYRADMRWDVLGAETVQEVATPAMVAAAETATAEAAA